MSASNAAFPLDALASDYDEWKYGPGKNISIVRSSSAIVSVAASSLLVRILFRSRDGIHSTYNRLLLGLSISDIVLSLSFATFGAVVPSEWNYAVWNARGSRASCDAFGFFSILGAFSGLLYMCSLNLYFLAKVKFNRTDSYVAKKLEPWLLGVPALFGLIVSITFLAKQGMNANIIGSCDATNIHEPPHCDGYEDGDTPEGSEIPCGRGRSAQPIFIVVGFITTFVVPITIGGSLWTIYRSVSRADRRISQYGAEALQNSRARPTTDDAAATDLEGGGGSSGGACSIRSAIMRRFRGRAYRTNSNNRGSFESRAVLQKAAAYSVAYFLTWIWVIIYGVLFWAGAWPTDLPRPKWQIAYLYVLYFFNPLQGMWTFLIYLQPNVIKRKRSSDGNISWFGAFADALRSAVTGRTNFPGRGRNRAGPGAPRTAAAPGRTGRNPTPAPGPKGRITPATAGSTESQGDSTRAEVGGLKADDPEEEKREVRSAESAGLEAKDPEDPTPPADDDRGRSSLSSEESEGYLEFLRVLGRLGDRKIRGRTFR